MNARGPYKPRRPLKSWDTLGQRIQALRQAFHLSQKELAKRLHVPQQSVSSWERNRSEPQNAGMAMLATLFGIAEPALRSGVGFSLPETDQLGVINPGTSSVGGVLVVEKNSKAVIRLPEAAPGEAWRVILGEAQDGALTKEAALELVAKAFEHGDTLWVLIKPKEDQPKGK